MVNQNPNFLIVIPNKITEYKQFIQKCCDFISDVNEIGADFGKISKFKLTIMELLTNAVKHSKTESYLEIVKEKERIVVRKTDKGNRFYFKDIVSNRVYQMPTRDFEPESSINVLLGNNYRLPILIKSASSIEFLSPEDINYDHLSGIPENFGLLIIKECSDQFFYHYNEQELTNTFEVVFKL